MEILITILDLLIIGLNLYLLVLTYHLHKDIEHLHDHIASPDEEEYHSYELDELADEEN